MLGGDMFSNKHWDVNIKIGSIFYLRKTHPSNRKMATMTSLLRLFKLPPLSPPLRSDTSLFSVSLPLQQSHRLNIKSRTELLALKNKAVWRFQKPAFCLLASRGRQISCLQKPVDGKPVGDVTTTPSVFTHRSGAFCSSTLQKLAVKVLQKQQRQQLIDWTVPSGAEGSDWSVFWQIFLGPFSEHAGYLLASGSITIISTSITAGVHWKQMIFQENTFFKTGSLTCLQNVYSCSERLRLIKGVNLIKFKFCTQIL